MEPNKDAITVRLGIFSGRPNPEISLDGQAAENFANLLKSGLGKEPIHPPPPPKLGYFYGFYVSAPGEVSNRLGIPPELSIHYGVITEGKGDRSNHWKAPAQLEQFLLEEAYKQGHSELLRNVVFEGPLKNDEKNR